MTGAYVYAIDEDAPYNFWPSARNGPGPFLIVTVCRAHGMRDICRLLCRRLSDRQLQILILRICAHGAPDGLVFGRGSGPLAQSPREVAGRRTCSPGDIRPHFGMIRRFWASNPAPNQRQLDPRLSIELHVCNIGAGAALGSVVQEFANQGGVPTKAADQPQEADGWWNFEGQVHTVEPQGGYRMSLEELDSYEHPEALLLQRPADLPAAQNFAGTRIIPGYAATRHPGTLNLRGIPDCAHHRGRNDQRNQDYVVR